MDLQRVLLKVLRMAKLSGIKRMMAGYRSVIGYALKMHVFEMVPEGVFVAKAFRSVALDQFSVSKAEDTLRQ